MVDKTSIDRVTDSKLSVSEVCKLMGVSIAAFYKRYRKAHDFPKPYKYTSSIQGRVRYSKREIDAWLLAHKG